MPRLLQIGEIATRCLRRVDLEFNSPFKPPEVKALISEQYGHLYRIAVKSGFRYFESEDSITATGAASYPLPDDHDSTIGIDRVVDAAGSTVQLDELMVQERNRFARQTGDARAYSIVGQTIVFFPRPSSGTYTHIYVPQAPDLSSAPDSTEVDLVTADGESFLIYGVAVKMTAKTEIDPRLLIQERDAAEARFTEDVGLRALHSPRRRVVMPTPFESPLFEGIEGDWRNSW